MIKEDGTHRYIHFVCRRTRSLSGHG